MQELDSQGLLQDTMIIFTTDNGYFHGEHGLAGKWYPYQESIRVPLIIYDPRMPLSKRNTLEDSFTLNIDLATTILGAAGITTPHPEMQGRDIADLYLPPNPSITPVGERNGPTPAWRQEFYYEFRFDKHSERMPICTALVRKDFKYIYWPQFKYHQLFHLTADPLEQNDLANHTGYSSVLREMILRHDELEQSLT